MSKDFTAAAHATLHFLHERFGFDLWIITRTQGDDWITLAVEDHGYGVKEGAVFSWADSFCSRMVAGLGPRAAPQVSAVASYAAAPIAQQLTIGAYVGIPLTRSDGSLFGTLCAIDPSPQNEQVETELALIELLADLLSSLLNAELNSAEAVRRAERAEADATRDPLTSLFNRRGWDHLLEKEEDRCRRYGHSACVISIDLDELKTVNDTQGHQAGDALIARAGQLLLELTRQPDVVARLGGDEFGILSVECDLEAAQALVERLRAGLQANGVSASLGFALRHPGKGLQLAVQEADAAMYRDKRNRRMTDTQTGSRLVRD